MASKQDITPFVLKNVQGLDSGEQKGSGAYGAVYEVTVKGVTSIAKRLHDILVTQVSRQERDSIQRKFVAECALLSTLRHPNVVHFVGVHYGKSKNDLSLVMECLHTDLAKFLEGCSSAIPLSIKLSILLDVSYGLLYFHTHTPPIIHRDLSASNILLTTDLRAKIADLGVAKLLDPQKQVAIAQTQTPGALHYMPPEALKQNPVYDLKLDIFSFGHLTLYVAAEKLPSVHELDDVTMYVALQQRQVQIERRREAIEQIGGERHTLYPLITQCLQDKVECRPTTTELNASLKELCTKYPHSVAEVSKFSAQADKRSCAGNETALIETRHQNERLKLANDQLRKEKDLLMGRNAQLDSQLRQLQELAQYQRNVVQLTTEVEQLRREKADLVGEVEAHKLTVDKFAREADEWKRKYSEKEAEAHQERVRRKGFERKIANLEKVNYQLRQESNLPLPLKAEPPSASYVKLSPPMWQAHSSSETSSQKPLKLQEMLKVHSVDEKTILSSQGRDAYSQQTSVTTDDRVSTLPHSAPPLLLSEIPAFAHSFQLLPSELGGDEPPLPPRTASADPKGFGDVPSSSPYIDGGWEHSSNMSTTGPPSSQYNASPIIAGTSHLSHATTQPDVPLGYHHQPQLAHLQKRNAFPHHSILHPSYPNATPSLLPPMPSINSEVNSYHRHAHDDSGLYRERTPDFVKNDSPPSSDMSNQSSQPPEASQQPSQYSRGHQQPAGVTAGAGSGRLGVIPSCFNPANSPRSQQTYPPQQRETSYPTPMSHVPVSHQPIPHAQFDHQGPNITSNLLDEPHSRHTPPALTANLHYSVQEMHTCPPPQVKYPPGMRGEALNTVVTSQPNQGLESNQLEMGIEREIYFEDKNVIKSDSEAPQTLVNEDIPYDPNLICPKCKLNFRIGEIQKYRRHVATCQVSRK